MTSISHWLCNNIQICFPTFEKNSKTTDISVFGVQYVDIEPFYTFMRLLPLYRLFFFEDLGEPKIFFCVISYIFLNAIITNIAQHIMTFWFRLNFLYLWSLFDLLIVKVDRQCRRNNLLSKQVYCQMSNEENLKHLKFNYVFLIFKYFIVPVLVHEII